MRRLACALIAGVCCLALGGQPASARCEGHVPQPKPQNTGRDIVGQTYDQIVERGYAVFAVYEDFPPFAWEEGGELRGVDVELGRIIADFLGVEARFRAVAAAESVDDDLRNNVWKGHYMGGGVANVMLHVPYDVDFACRNEQVVLTGQYFNETLAIAFDRAAYPDGGPLPGHFRSDSVGVENDSLSDFYLSGLAAGQLQPNIRRYPTTEAAMAALAAGEIKAVMGARTQLEHELPETLAVHAPPLPGLARGQWTLGVAVRHSYRQLAYAVGDAVQAAVQDGRVAAVFARYGITHNPPAW